MSTLTLYEAAKLLHVHPVSLREMARDGVVPGAKVGKRWIFVYEDIIEYIRLQYARRRALQGEHTEVTLCHSSNAKIHLIGGSNSPTTDAEYSKALGLPTK